MNDCEVKYAISLIYQPESLSITLSHLMINKYTLY